MYLAGSHWTGNLYKNEFPQGLYGLCGNSLDSTWRKRIGVEPTNGLTTVHWF